MKMTKKERRENASCAPSRGATPNRRFFVRRLLRDIAPGYRLCHTDLPGAPDIPCIGRKRRTSCMDASGMDVATRYTKLLANFMGFMKLAALAIWLK
jgi:hypothetical protein